MPTESVNPAGAPLLIVVAYLDASILLLSPYWITTDRSVVQPTKKHLQCTPVQVAYRVFNRDESVRDGQICMYSSGV